MGGGWTVIQKRISDAVSFDRDWQTYGEGFGSPDGNLWIGNEMIHELTKDKKTSLYISITTDGLPLYVLYEEFYVANAENKYKLFLRGSVEGTLGDKMLYLDQVESGYILSGMSFSTSDADNDLWQNGHCAVVHKGGWWYNNCHYAFLNGPWASATWDNPWKDKIENGADVTETKMMIKRA
ncbi:ficolin-2-like [Saccostrea cucullata]|uniref:ficolin-2-like n=1 Tax=Saccostrea cuccullata TaxID=36930 RepID=UPI002ED3C3E1